MKLNAIIKLYQFNFKEIKNLRAYNIVPSSILTNLLASLIKDVKIKRKISLLSISAISVSKSVIII